MKKLNVTLLVVALMMILSNAGWGQVSLTSTVTPYSQNFNTLAITGTTNTWTDNTTVAGWYTNRVVYIGDDGTNTTGGLHSYGTTSSTERSIGALTSGSTATVYIGTRLINNTGSTVTSFNVSYKGEQWRQTTNAHKLVFEYQVGATSLTTGTWTAVTALDFTAPKTGTAGALDGNATGNFANISGTITVSVSNSQEIWFRWTKTASTSPGLAVDDFSVLPIAGATTPTVTSPTFTGITTTSAVLGGNITNDGGSTLTSRGTVWKTSTGVTISDNLLAEGSISTGVFTHTRTSLPSGSQIFFKAYAINGIGTTLSSESSFWTLSTEPSTYPLIFANNVISQTQIDLSFSALTTLSNATGYIIMQKSGSAISTGVPTDANSYSVGNTIGDATVAAIITNTSATSTSITGLSAGTNYFFTIIPFNNSSNAATYNYKTDGTIPGTNGSTLAPNSTDSWVDAPSSQVNPGTISSLVDTDAEALEVFKFNINDKGGDFLETMVNQISIFPGTNNNINWISTIQGVKLSIDGGSTFVTTGTTTITNTSILIPITSGDLNVADGSSTEVSLFIFLKNTGITDNKILEFNIPANSHGFIADALGSTFLTSFSSATTSNQLMTNVVGTKMNFVQQPSNTFLDVTMTPSVTIEVTDANNNRDLDNNGSVSLISSGTMTGTPLNVTLVSGFGTFGSIVHTATGSGLTLTASLIGFADLVSTSFNISSAPSITGLFLPQYMQGMNGTNNSRLPFVFLAQLDNLKPSSTYRYYNLAALSTDLPTASAGIVYIANTSGNFTTASTGSFSTAGSYGEFTTDVNGTYKGWFIMGSSANVRFTPNNYLFMRIVLNNGAGGTAPATYLTLSDSVKVINFGATSTEGTGIRSSAFATPKNFVLLYDNTTGTGRPISGTLVESDGATPTSMASFYTTYVDGLSGAWGAIIPNDLALGIRRIEQRSLINTPSLNPGDLINFQVSVDGMWGVTNTVNPTSGTTALVINDAPLPVHLSSLVSSSIGRSINLNWTTASENNNAGFNVERTIATETTWEKIGFVSGHGTVNTPTNYSFEDKNLQTGKYKYRLKQIDVNGNFEYFALNGEVEIGVPKKFDMSQNYPNPFNPVTKINFDLPENGLVNLRLYDMLGREVATLVNEVRNAGYYTVNFDASKLSSGIYFYRMNAGKFSSIKKMAVIK